MIRTSSEGRIYHGENGARTADGKWRDGDVFVVVTTGATYVRTAGAWVAVGASDHGALDGLADDDHTQYLLASAATSRAAFASNWTDLTDGGGTTLHTHAGTDSGWTAATPATGYSSSSMLWSDAAAAKYRKLNGVVYLSGALKCTDAGYTVAFTLPEGYRPAHLMYFNGIFVTSGSAEGQESISVETDGDVVIKAPFANNTYHFDGISFPV